MKAKTSFILMAVFTLFFFFRLSAEDRPVLTPDGSGGPSDAVVSPGDSSGEKPKETPKAAGGATIMTAEQGEDLAKKIDKVQEDQKKILEKLDQLEKEMDFLKASVRTR